MKQSENEILQERIAELEKQVFFYKTIADYTYDWEVFRNTDGKIVYINSAFERITGYSSTDLLSGKITEKEIVHPDDWEHTAKHLKQLPNKVPIDSLEFRIIRNDKQIRFINLCALPVFHNNEFIGTRSSGRDVTGKVNLSVVTQTVKELQESESKHKEAQQLAQIGHWELDIENNRLFWSDEIYRIFNCNPQTFGATLEAFMDFIHPEDKEYVTNAYINHINNREPYNIFHRITTSTGELKYVNEICKSEYDHTGKAIRSIGIVSDVTNLKNIENKLNKNQELFSLFMKYSPIYTYIKEVTEYTSKVTLVSDNFIDMIGIPATEMIGKNMYELFEHDFAKKITTDDYHVVSEGNIITLEEELNGKYYTTIKFPIKQDDKTLLAGYTIDITDRKKNELLLKQKNDFINEQNIALIKAKILIEDRNASITNIIESSSESIWAFDTNYKIIYLNNVFQTEFFQSFGVKLQAGMNLFEALPIALRDTWKQRYDQALNNKKLVFEDAVPTENGTIYIQATINPILINNTVIGAGCYASNITERKKAELELKRAKEKAEESDRLKTAFLQNLSHEIRTPMNAIINFSDFLLSPKTTDEKKKSYIEIIRSSSKELLNTVNDTLTISELETKQETIKETVTNINRVITELHTSYLFQIINRNITITPILALPDTDANVLIDKTKLVRILNNLVSNALKFTFQGSIEISYTLSDDKKYIRFSVTDTGIGIEPEKHGLIFGSFMQADLSIRNNYRGSGLGLAICKGFVELMGGSIGVKSEPDKGSEFYFTVPYKPVI